MLTYYSYEYGEGPDVTVVWRDAYNGIALANAIECVLAGLYFAVIFTGKPSTSM